MPKIARNKQDALSSAWLMKSITLFLLFFTTLRIVHARDSVLSGGDIEVNGEKLGNSASFHDIQNAVNRNQDYWEKEFKIDEQGDSPLHRAVDRNDLDEINDLLSLKITEKSYYPVLEHKNKLGHTALQNAVIHGHLKFVKTLVKFGAQIQVLDGEKNSLLHWVANRNHAHLVEYLFKKGVPLEHKNANGHTALGTAGVGHNNLVFTLLLHLGANPHVDVPYTDTNNKLSLLAQAANLNDLYQVELLLKAGVTVDQPDTTGSTPLMLAALQNFTDIARTLLNAGADINFQNKLNLLHAAVETNKSEIVDFAVQHGADLEAKTKLTSRTPLSLASSYNNTQRFEQLLILGANPNGEAIYNEMPILYEIISVGQVKNLELLLKYKADPNKIYNNAFTPLIYTLRINELIQTAEMKNMKGNVHAMPPEDRVQIVKLLLAAGADLNLAPHSQTPLHVAAFQGDLTMVKLLIRAGADIHAVFENENALSIAMSHFHFDVANYLKAKGAKMLPSFAEKMQVRLLKITDHVILFLSNPIMRTLIMAAVIIKAVMHFNQKRVQRNNSIIQAEKRRVQELVKRNNDNLNSLNQVLQHFYPFDKWQLQQTEFVFTAQNAVNPRYSLMADAVLATIVHHLATYHFNVQEYDAPNKLIRLKLAEPEKSNSLIASAEVIERIRVDLNTQLQAKPSYQFEQLQKEMNVLQQDFVKVKNQQSNYEKLIQNGVIQSTDLQADLAALMAIQQHCLENKKVATTHQALQRLIAYFVEQADCPDITPYSNARLDEQFTVNQTLIKKLMIQTDLIDQSTASRDEVEKLRLQFINAQGSLTKLNEFLFALNTLSNTQKDKLQTHFSKLKDLIYDYNQEQKSNASLLARESMLVRKEVVKTKPTPTLPPEPKPRLTTSMPRVAQATSVVTPPKKAVVPTPIVVVRKELDYKQLQTHILNLGDLLQAFQDDQSDQNQLDYKYAMLLEALRVFELTKQVTFNRVALSIRNALMHNHRYIDFETIIEFAHSIAHMPSGERANASKLEDALRSADQGAKLTTIGRLGRALNKLQESDLYHSHALAEHEKPSAKVYLETISYLLEDLSRIQIKAGNHLDAYPNKVRAIKGILYCIGECQQQLFLLDNENLMIRRFIRAKTLNKNGLAELLKSALKIRESVGHSERIEIDNNEEFTVLAHQLDLFRRHAAEIKSDLVRDVLLLEDRNSIFEQVPRPLGSGPIGV